jgi:PAS domain S-box-containing protein
MKEVPGSSPPSRKSPGKPTGTKKEQKKKTGVRKQDQAMDWETVFRAIGSPAVILSPDHTILSANNATCHRTGIAEAELKGMKCWEVFHGRDTRCPPQGCPMVQVLSSGKHETAEMEVSINGRVCLVSCTPVFDTPGVIGSVIHIATDIMEKKRAERSVQESEQRYRNIITNTGAGYFHIDTEGRFISVNPAWLRLHGFSTASEVIGKPFSVTQIDADRQAARERVEGLLHGENILHGEFTRRLKDGTTGYHTFSASPVIHNGRVTGLEGFLIDSTERKRAEDALRKSEEMFRNVFDWANDAVMLHTLTTEESPGRFIDVNQVACLMLGYTRDELLTMGPPDIVPAELHLQLREIIREADSKKSVLFETRFRRKDGSTFPVESSGHLINQQGKMIWISHIRDVSDRKRSDEQREHLIQELAQKNTELGRFTYTVSHDLRSPLIAIQAYLSLLGEDLKSGNTGQVQTDLARIHESAEKLESLINTLLKLSRSGKSVDAPEPISFTDLSREAAGMLEASLKKRGVTLVIPDNLPEVKGDRQRLQQVMTNLIDNAVKFMGGQKDPRVELSVRADNGSPVFCVRDNGMGIQKENLPKVFGLFERFNPDIPGSGIGLATVKRIVEAHGGRIWVESEGAGKGTTVCFTLPVVESNPEKRD